MSKRLTLHPPKPNTVLEALLEHAREHPATEAELREQRRNVAPYQSGEDASHQLFRELPE